MFSGTFSLIWDDGPEYPKAFFHHPAAPVPQPVAALDGCDLDAHLLTLENGDCFM